jgi:hypothetical protein
VIASACASSLALLLAAAPQDKPALAQFVESRIDVGVPHFEYQLADVDGDRRVDLFVTSAVIGERTLRLWRQRPDATFPAEADFRFSVPPDVVAWGLLDLRPEPGKELLLLTRNGVFSLTTTQPGLQGNLRREIALPLFPDLADPSRLPCWRLAKDVDGDGREELLVLSEGRELALGVAREGPDAGKLVRVLDVGAAEEIEEDDAATMSFGDSGIHIRSRTGLQSMFPGARSSRPLFQQEKLFSQRHRYKIPTLLDWNGDGKLDAVRFASRVAQVRLRQPDGTFEADSKPFPYPSGAAGDGEDEGGRTPRSEAQLADVDGDGRDELVLFRKEGDGFGKDSIALIFPRGPDGQAADTPSARVKLPGMDVEWELADVDHDGHDELLARVIDIPTGLSTLTTIRLDVAFYAFRGKAGAQLSREPEIRFERSFKPEQLARVQETLLTRLNGDFDGDGVSDLVYTQLDGRVEIRAVVKKDGQLVLQDKPFASFMPQAPVDRLETWDVSDDGVADLMLRHEKSFTLFVSRRRSGS